MKIHKYYTKHLFLHHWIILLDIKDALIIVKISHNQLAQRGGSKTTTL